MRPRAPAIVVLYASLLRGAAVDDKAWSMLSQGLADEHAEKRIHSVAAFSVLKPAPYTVSLVENALVDQDPQVRQTAVETLEAMKSRSSIPKLKAALADPSPEVSFCAARVLWGMGDRSGQDILLQVVAGERKTTPGAVSSSMRDARSKLRNPAAMALFGAKTGAGIMFGPVGFGFTMIQTLMKDRAAAARALSAALLAENPSPESVALIEDALGDKVWAVRAAAVKALAAVGSKEATAKIEPLLEDKHEEVRTLAAAAIVRLSGRLLTPPGEAAGALRSPPGASRPAPKKK